MGVLIKQPNGLCGKHTITVSTSDGIVELCKISGGCPGLSRAVCALIEGMPAVEVIQKLKGIPCGNRATSCPNEIALAIEEA